MFDLHGRVAVVSGASSGLGKQMACALARQGADLLLLARREDKLHETLALVKENGAPRGCVFRCDVTSSEDIKRAMERCDAFYGRCDILVNCAGASKDKGVLEMTDDEWDFTIATDETSVFKMTRAFAWLMMQNGYGRIINIASMYGLVGNTEIPTVAYHTSKGGVVNFTRAVAAELAPHGITCNAICPGYFNTELTSEVLASEKFQKFANTHVPMRRYGNPGELDAAVVFLASEEASYVTGAILPVDGGYTCV